MYIIINNITAARGGGSGVFIYIFLYILVPEVREVVKKLPRGRRIHSVRVSARTEPWRPDSCTGKIVNYEIFKF